jgi:hypothetical protein
MLWNMARRLHNWSYNNVTNFLRENGFSFLKELGGSHQAWVKRGGNNEPDWRVGINFTHGSYPLVTLKRMIRQSGIDQEKWIKWAGS